MRLILRMQEVALPNIGEAHRSRIRITLTLLDEALVKTTTPATMMRENKKRPTSPPKKSPRAHTTNRYARIKISKAVRQFSVDQDAHAESLTIS